MSDKKYALVTGGSRGIGGGVVDALKAKGYEVAVFARNTDNLKDVLAVTCDVADEEQQLKAFAKVKEEFPRLDVCFINAGISGFGEILDMPTDEWDRVININLRGAFITLREAGKWMRDTETGGSIVACCSLTSFAAEKNLAHYSSAKAGLMMLVKTAARELGQYQITVNGIAPGLTKTELIAGSEGVPGFYERVSQRTPLGRLGEIEDIVPEVIRLVETKWVTGQTLIADGGLSLFTAADPLEEV